MERGGLRVIDEQGVIYNPLARRVAALDRHRRELHADGGAQRIANGSAVIARAGPGIHVMISKTCMLAVGDGCGAGLRAAWPA